MNKILRKLNQWKDSGLISEPQFESIKKYEEDNAPKNVGAYTIITLGAIVICIGIISLIASNWEYLGDLAKLFIDFCVLSSLAYFTYRFKESEKKWVLETLIVSYFILILASIGLISQVYNTGGAFYQAALFWCVITLPIVLFSTGKVTTHIWFISFLFSFTSLLFETVNSFKEDEIVLIWIFSILPQILLSISFPLRASNRANLQTFGNTALFWSVFGFLFGTILISFLNLIDEKLILQSLEMVQGLLLMTVLFSGINVYLSIFQNRKLSIFLIIGFTAYILQFCSHLFSFDSKLLDTFLFIIIWFIAGFIFHLLESKKLFEFAIVCIGLRFLVAYFQLFTSLIFTGFGLIFSGVFIIIICVSYIKNRDKITKYIGDLV